MRARRRPYGGHVTYKLRDQSPGLHHISMRGNNKRLVFRDENDRAHFLGLLDDTALKEGWAIYAYALMTNHFHLVMRIGDRGLGDGMCRLNTAYATWFNQQNERINHLFGKRYWSERLTDERRVKAALRYVIRNPRRAGVPGPLESHTWTSYAATIGLALSRVRLAKDELLALFASNAARAIELFRALCEDDDDPDDEGTDWWQPP
jgi:REP element-mobilizing transposase RayT